MQFKAALITATLVASASANPLLGSIQKGGFCGTAQPTEEQRQESRNALAQVAASFAPQVAFDVTVPVYFHVLAADKTVKGGYLARDTLIAQMKQLNADYVGTGFQFELKDIDWTVNAQWAKDQDRRNMRSQLRKGDYGTLNLYFQNNFLGGSCNYPRSGASNMSQDGCYISKDTVPGASNSGVFNGGKVVTHEAGHWLNLIHTFEGGCEGVNDEVDDTPAESQKGGAQGCPVGSDTCPNDPGDDPIHNHMTYTADSCRTEFTPGQIDRMQQSWTAFRAGN